MFCKWGDDNKGIVCCIVMESGSASANMCATTGASPAAIVGTSLSAPSDSALVVREAHASEAEGTQVEPECDITGENEPPNKKQKKSISKVWEHYTKDIVTKTDSNGVITKEHWAKCKKCTYKARCETTRGTSCFINHLRNKHSITPGQQLIKLEKGEDSTANVQTYRFDAETSLKKWHLALVMHEYPFNMVEHEFFVDFIKSLRPSFSFKCRTTTRNAIMEMFNEETKKLYDHFKSLSCRFSATMDMWTSNQNKGYMCVTVHWIDDNWQIQKRIAKFMHVKGSHTGTNLALEFVKSVMHWNLEKKLFALTMDNASSNDKCAAEVVAKLNKKASLVCDGAFFHVRCLCHILNLVAQDGLKAVASSVQNIRATVVIVKNSPLQWEHFQKCATECDLDINEGLPLDVSTRWNSTFLMLKQAIYYRKAFERLLELNESKYKKCAPLDEEWDNAIALCRCLRRLYEATLLFSGTTYPTTNLFWWKFCEIKLAIAEWCHSSDITIHALAIAMQAKYDKYWEKSNIALAVACFLDPRYKKKLVEYFMKKIYGEERAIVELHTFMTVVNQLFQVYMSSTPQVVKPKTVGSSVATQSLGDDLGVLEIEEFLYETAVNVTRHNEKSELDIYMKEPNFRWIESEDGPFDILSWWRTKQGIFPTLSRLARDVLAIQVSTVASESAFSAGGRVVDPFRSRLDPEVVEALICTKDWTTSSRRGSKENIATLMDEMDLEYKANVCDSPIDMTSEDGND